LLSVLSTCTKTLLGGFYTLSPYASTLSAVLHTLTAVLSAL
jgi:hypothetical protein